MRIVARVIAGTRERLRALFLGRRADADMEEELRFHLAMEAAKLEKSGLPPAEATRVAAATLGGVTRYREEVRDARGFAWLSGTRLDFALGLRMMRKHPALSVVGGLGMAVGVALSVGMFAFIRVHIYPTLPLEEGERVVSLENRLVQGGVNNEDRHAVHDFVAWRDELKSIEQIGAFRDVTLNVSFGGEPTEPSEPAQMAEMSAAGFRVARVAPLMGRFLVDDDERPGAPPVIVIGYDVWQKRFGGRADVVGRSMRLNGTPYTIVGVMPRDFAFPRSHSLWIPFRPNPLAVPRRKGPEIYIYGRLAPGATMESAQAELTAFGERTAAVHPENAHIEPMVMPYIDSIIDIQGMSPWVVVQIQLMMTLLLIVVSLNVAMLVYARTATRQSEIAVRTALGASRMRIVSQLFIEALTLSLCSALVGLGIAQVGLRLASMVLEDGIGNAFWVSYRLEPVTVLFTVGMAVLAAVIIGVLPGLKATGKQLQASLRSMSGAAMRLGRTWTTLIIAQVALAVAVLPGAVGSAWREMRQAFSTTTFPADSFAVAVLETELTDSEGRQIAPTGELGDRLREMLRRMNAEPTVSGATYWAALPGRSGRIEVEGLAVPPGTNGFRVRSNGVALNYLDVYGSRLLAGRTLAPGDLDTSSTNVVVTRAFVEQVLAGEPALGRRIRYAARPQTPDTPQTEPSRWYRIVGVIDDFEHNSLNPEVVLPELYYAVSPEHVHLARH